MLPRMLLWEVPITKQLGASLPVASRSTHTCRLLSLNRLPASTTALQGISAIVLVAPAIVALWPGPPQQAQRDGMATGLAVVEEMVSAQDPPDELEVDSLEESDSPTNAERADAAAAAAAGTGPGLTAAAAGGGGGKGLHFRHKAARWRPVRVAVAVAQAAALFLAQAVLRLATPLLVLLLRRLVRSRRCALFPCARCCCLILRHALLHGALLYFYKFVLN
jgi:hypothetical protein